MTAAEEAYARAQAARLKRLQEAQDLVNYATSHGLGAVPTGLPAESKQLGIPAAADSQPPSTGPCPWCTEYGGHYAWCPDRADNRSWLMEHT